MAGGRLSSSVSGGSCFRFVEDRVEKCRFGLSYLAAGTPPGLPTPPDSRPGVRGAARPLVLPVPPPPSGGRSARVRPPRREIPPPLDESGQVALPLAAVPPDAAVVAVAAATVS